MRVICTGISGTDRLGWLRQIVDLAARHSHAVTLYDVRETMFAIAEHVGEPVSEETVLDMFPRALVLLRAAALEQICSRIEHLPPDHHWILNTHAVFRWKNTLISGFDPHYLERLDPHLFVTVTSGVPAVQAQLADQPRWSGLSAETILTWRAEEQFFTAEMARIHRKPQMLVPRATAVPQAYRLLFEPGCPRVYLSYPMQHVLSGQARDLAQFKRRLSESLVVFDPADVDDGIGSGAELAPATGEAEGSRSGFQQHVADQIVERDYKLIDQSDAVIVYYDVPVPSPGVISEMKFALESGRRVYGLWLPDAEPSVFFTRYCSTWFRSADALLEHARRHLAPSAPDGTASTTAAARAL